jgi:hypothetical protein
MRGTRVASADSYRKAGRSRPGSDNTHCRIGMRGMTASHGCAAVDCIGATGYRADFR